MSKEPKSGGIIAKIKSVKHIEIIVAVIAVVVMLVIYFTTIARPSSKSDSASAESAPDYCARMESELTDLVSNMKGAGAAKVLINWESSVESVIAYVTNSSSNSTSSSPQLIQSGGSSKPIVLKEIYPKAVGVVIICQGGEDVKLKIEIITAVSTLLDITPDKITVYAMKK